MTTQSLSDLPPAVQQIQDALDAGPTSWDYDSNQTPFYNDADGHCRGGDNDGTYILYGPDFFIEGERYTGPVLTEQCGEKDAKYIAACNPANMREVLAERKSLRLRLEAAEQRVRGLLDDLQFVERWANHHGAKPHMTAQEALSCIQHYPGIVEITRSYADGKVPETRNPWAERDAAMKEIDRLREVLDHNISERAKLAALALPIDQGEKK